MLRTTLILAGTLIVMAGCGPVQDPTSPVGRVAPDFEVETLQSRSVTKTLSSLKGHPVILDFWATWCGPCRILSPHVEKIYEDFKGQGLEAMAISDEKREAIQAFESVTPHKMPVYVDQNDLATNAYEVRGLPTVVIIDKSGKIVYQMTGFIPGTLGQTEQAMHDAVAKAFSPTT
jgi:thiol-disulfide isomerase/thioredoxin